MIHRLHLKNQQGIEWIWAYSLWFAIWELFIMLSSLYEHNKIWIDSERSNKDETTTHHQVRIS